MQYEVLAYRWRVTHKWAWLQSCYHFQTSTTHHPSPPTTVSGSEEADLTVFAVMNVRLQLNWWKHNMAIFLANDSDSLCLFILQMATACLPTDSRVMAKIKQLVRVGVRRVPEMQRHVKHYVENELFASGNVPPLTDARFWPSSSVIVNCIYKTVRQLRYYLFLTYATKVNI